MDLKKTLFEQIYEILRNDILTQTILYDSKLTLEIFQECLRVSSIPIREALTWLTEEQLASYYSNIDVSVASLDGRDVREIYQFTGDLNSLAVSYASFHPNQGPILEELREDLSLMDAYGLPSPKWQDLSDRFHLILYDYCQNSCPVHSAQRTRSQMSILAYQYEKQVPKQGLTLNEHHMIFRLHEAGDHQGVAAMMKEHLSHSLEFTREMLYSPAWSVSAALTHFSPAGVNLIFPGRYRPALSRPAPYRLWPQLVRTAGPLRFSYTLRSPVSPGRQA